MDENVQFGGCEKLVHIVGTVAFCQLGNTVADNLYT